MNSLVELGEFVGLGNGTPARPDGGQTVRKPLTIRAAADNLSTVLSGTDRNSLRAMMQALPRLAPVSLEAERVSGIAEETPFAPAVRIHPSGGQVLWTTLCAFNAELPGDGGDFQAVGGAIGEKHLENVELDQISVVTLSDPKVYIFKVSRAGIVPDTGITVLEKEFLFRVNPKPGPPKPKPPAPPNGIQPTTAVSSSSVALLNCYTAKRVLDIRSRDMTLGEDFNFVAMLESQFDDGGTCPAFGSTPVEIPLVDQHWHEIVALDSERQGCIINEGDEMDPHNVSCWEEHIVIFGDKNGTVFRVIVE